jgi:ABC-type glycerol-3-phosphate transport system substrate-binding protein
MKNHKLSRRGMLKLIGTGAGAIVLASCAPKATEAPVQPTAVVVAPTEAPAPTQPPAEVKPTEVPPTEAPKKVTLRYQNHWTKETDAHVKGMAWLYAEFQKANPDITIENILNPDSAESYKKIVSDCAAGDCPDIIHGPGPEMWESGYLLDLKPYLDEAWMSVLIPSTFFTAGDAVYALDGEFSPMSTIWNTRILTAAGVSAPPTTWEEMLDACDKIKKSGKTPTSWGVGGVHQWHNIIMSQEGGYEALAANKFDADQIKEAFARTKVFVDNKWIPDNEIELTWQQSVAMFVAEETAFYLNGAWTLGNEVRGAGAAADLRDNVKFVPYPKVGAKGTTVELKKTTGIGVAKSVEKDPAKLDAAIKFMKFWFSAEGGKQWILLTQSPMGVAVDVTKIEGVDPLLVEFLGAKDKADLAYALPDTKALQQRGWDDCFTGLQKLMSGGSVDEAMKVYQDEMSQYV